MKKAAAEKITIAHLRSDYPELCGPDILLSSAAERIDRSKFNMMVVTLQNRRCRGRHFLKNLEGKNVKTETITWCKLNPILPASVRLARLIRAYNVDILHSHDMWSMLIGFIGARLGGSLVAAHAHGWHRSTFGVKGRFCDFVDRLVFRFSDRVFVGSEAMRAELAKLGISAKKVRTIANTADLERFEQDLDSEKIKEKLEIDAGCKIVGTVGRLYAEKGHKVLLEAARRTISEFRLVEFLIVGEGPLRRELERYAAELGIKEHVRFTGYYENLAEILSVLDIFVLPSLAESLPLTVMEAMASGKAVVAADVGGVSEIVKNGQTGLLVEANDSVGLSRAIISLLKAPGRCKRLGQAGRKRVLAEFSTEKMVKALETAYTEMMVNGSRGKKVRQGLLRRFCGPDISSKDGR